MLSGRFWSDDCQGFWAHADGKSPHRHRRESMDLADVAHGGQFGLRSVRLPPEAHRGRGFGVPVLRALTELVFTRWRDVRRFEGHAREDNTAMRATFRRAGWVKEAFHRDAWSVDRAPPKSSVAYAVLAATGNRERSLRSFGTTGKPSALLAGPNRQNGWPAGSSITRIRDWSRRAAARAPVATATAAATAA